MSNDGMRSYFVRSLAVRRVFRVLGIIGILGGLAMVVIGLMVGAGNESIGVHKEETLVLPGIVTLVLCAIVLCMGCIRKNMRKNSVVLELGRASDHDAKGKATNVVGAGGNYNVLGGYMDDRGAANVEGNTVKALDAHLFEPKHEDFNIRYPSSRGRRYQDDSLESVDMPSMHL